jgi:DNA-binding transcriptional ArsR family regulator
VPRSHKPLKEETLELVAERFRLLGDPLRLRLLQTLAAREMSVAQLVETTSTTQANVSKHLQLLLRAGIVKRRKDGLHSYYAIADASVFPLCDLVCGSLSAHLEGQLAAFEPPRPPAPARTKTPR